MTERLERILGLERRIELTDGHLTVGGSAAATRLVLQELLQRCSLQELVNLGGEAWLEAAHLAPARASVQAEEAGFPYARHYGLLQRLTLPLYALFGGDPWLLYTRDIVVKLAQDALTPDVFVTVRDARTPMRAYYLEGPPVLVLEVVPGGSPARELFRLGCFERHGVPEVWWLDVRAERAIVFTRSGACYRARVQRRGWLESRHLPGLVLNLDEAWQPGWDPPLTVRLGAYEVRDALPSASPPKEVLAELRGAALGALAEVVREPPQGHAEVKYGDLPFAPRVGLAPGPVSFEAFISWAPEAKFEVMGGELVVGSFEGSLQLLGMLLMNAGRAGAWPLLTAEQQEGLRGELGRA